MENNKITPQEKENFVADVDNLLRDYTSDDMLVLYNDKDEVIYNFVFFRRIIRHLSDYIISVTKKNKIMSIISETFYTVQCDRCGKILAHETLDVLWRGDKEYAKEEASEHDWAEINGKHYCPDCYEVDGEHDECKVKE